MNMTTKDTLGRKNLTTTDLVKGQRYVIVLSGNNGFSGECIANGFSGFRLNDGRVAWPNPGHIRAIYAK